MKKATFTHRDISIQTWNNNNTQLISEHKTLQAAERMLNDCNKTAQRDQNEYHIEEIK